MRQRAALFTLCLGVICGTMLVGANIYQMVVEVPNWHSDIPASLRDYRASTRHSHPGYFFQVLTPISIWVMVASLWLGWVRQSPRNRWVVASTVLLVACELFTLLYFFPRNELLFFQPLESFTVEALQSAGGEWVRAHVLRMVLGAGAIYSGFRALLISAALPPAAVRS